MRRYRAGSGRQARPSCGDLRDARGSFVGRGDAASAAVHAIQYSTSGPRGREVPCSA